MPLFPHCSFKNNHADDMGIMLEYSLLPNILHYPSGSIPITTVKKEEEDYTDNINDMWTKWLKEDAKDSAGMPINI